MDGTGIAAEFQSYEESESGTLFVGDGYDRLEVRIRRGTTIDGAVVALCPAEDGTITADVCIDGPPVP